jgi:Zn-dependent protease/CBS domain-containing protein
LLLLGWVVLSQLIDGRSVGAAVQGGAYVVAVFAIIVLHELGHALAARRFGISTRDITLLPIGGVSRLERMPSKPSQELFVAVAGPVVNIVLAAILFGLLAGTGTLGNATLFAVAGAPFLVKLMWTNMGLAVFNLIPAFPMDGGRVFRALLALRMDHVRATDVAASVGKTVAFVFGLIGLWGNPILVLIALFIWIGAHQEARLAHVNASLCGISVSRAMVNRVASVSPDDLVANALQQMFAGFQEYMPVVVESRLVGVFSRQDALRAAQSGQVNAPVSSFMQGGAPSVEDTESLDVALERLQESGRRSIPVVHDHVLVGLLPLENVAYVLQVQERARLAHARA